MPEKKKQGWLISNPALFEHSLNVARKVLPFLGERGIPATPQNYMIFYTYFESNLSRVKKIVDDELALNRPWDEETSRRIFDLLFSDEVNLGWRELNERLANQLKDVTEDIIEETSATAEMAEETGVRLDSTLIEARAVRSIEQMTSLLDAIASDVGQVGQASRSLGQTLKEKGAELDEALQALEEVEHLALTDELTGLGNRRAWEARLKEEFHRHRRYGTECAVLMMDLDDFKPINDEHGHLVGDQVLHKIGSLILSLLRESDFGARYGGEEFACLLVNADLDKAFVVAERLRRAVELARIETGRKTISLTASLGVARFREDDPDPRAAVDRADQALYAAKAKGKNQTVSETDLDQS